MRARLMSVLPPGTVPVGLGLLVAGVTAYGFLVVSARALGPEAYAPLSVMWALVFTAGPGIFLPLEQGVSRAIAIRRVQGVGARPVLVRASLVGAAILGVLYVVMLVFRGPITTRLFDGEGLLLLGTGVSLVGYAAIHLTRGVLSGAGRFGVYGSLLGVEGVLRVAGAAVLFGLGVRTVGLYGMALGVAPLLALVAAYPARDALPDVGPTAAWSELSTSLGLLLVGSTLAQGLANASQVAVMLLASRAEQAVAGRFLASLVVARVPLFLFSAVQAALLPRLAGLVGSGELHELRRLVTRLMLALTGFGVLVTAAGFAFGPFAVRLLFGDDFALGPRDLGLLAAGSAIYLVCLALAQAGIAIGAFGRVAAAWGVGVATFVVLVLLGSDLLLRVEVAFLGASLAATGSLWLLLRGLLTADGAVAPEAIMDATRDLAIEP